MLIERLRDRATRRKTELDKDLAQLPAVQALKGECVMELKLFDHALRDEDAPQPPTRCRICHLRGYRRRRPTA